MSRLSMTLSPIMRDRLMLIRSARNLQGDPEVDCKAIVESLIVREHARDARLLKRRSARLERDRRQALRIEADGWVSNRLLNVMLANEVTSFQSLVENYTEADVRRWQQVGNATVKEIRKILTNLGLRMRSG